MRKRFLFGLVGLFLYLFVSLGAGCTTTSKSVEFEGDLVALKFNSVYPGGNTDNYLIFIKDSTPVNVFSRLVEFRYDSLIVNPRVAVWEKAAHDRNLRLHARIYFRDEAQLREYLR